MSTPTTLTGTRPSQLAMSWLLFPESPPVSQPALGQASGRNIETRRNNTGREHEPMLLLQALHTCPYLWGKPTGRSKNQNPNPNRNLCPSLLAFTPT